MNNSVYGNDFHKGRHEKTLYAADRIISIVLECLPKVESAIDIGCGVGTWLYAIENKGVKDIQGVDGAWVNKKQLVISESQFIEKDLNTTFSLNKKYDLAMSFEVAEHLKKNNAENIVSSLTELSDFVVFSAAHPYQGGVGHINEQWADYWIKLFEGHDYIALDLVRREIWLDEKIPSCYRKNVLFYVNKNRVSDLNLNCKIELYTPPEKYLLFFDKLTMPGIKQSFRYLLGSVLRYIKI